LVLRLATSSGRGGTLPHPETPIPSVIRPRRV
jgi:hypothetical protein